MRDPFDPKAPPPLGDMDIGKVISDYCTWYPHYTPSDVFLPPRLVSGPCGEERRLIERTLYVKRGRSQAFQSWAAVAFIRG